MSLDNKKILLEGCGV